MTSFVEPCASKEGLIQIAELRMKEMVSMGIGSKPFMDIKPSDAAISDRAIDYIMKGSGTLGFVLYINLLFSSVSLSQSHFFVLCVL
jgi:hypothetical protein